MSQAYRCSASRAALGRCRLVADLACHANDDDPTLGCGGGVEPPLPCGALVEPGSAGDLERAGELRGAVGLHLDLVDDVRLDCAALGVDDGLARRSGADHLVA